MEEKSNEITAIPDVLDSIDLTGAVVSIDAMGMQTGIAQGRLWNQRLITFWL